MAKDLSFMNNYCDWNEIGNSILKRKKNEMVYLYVNGTKNFVNWNGFVNSTFMG